MKDRRDQAGGRVSGGVLAIALALAGASTLLGASTARASEDRLHEVTWAHSSPGQVGRFVVLVSDERGDRAGARQVEVGLPAGASSGAFQFYSAIVPIGPYDYVAVAAYGPNGVLGGISSWAAPPPTRPGQPLVVEP